MSNAHPDARSLKGRTMVIIAVILSVALIHILRVGTYFGGTTFKLYYSYFSDIVVPFGMYFLLCLKEVSISFLRGWRVKSVLVFALGAFTEVAQAFGAPLLGRTFDPLDFTMFAAGALFAAFVDRIVFTSVFGFWSLKDAH